VPLRIAICLAAAILPALPVRAEDAVPPAWKHNNPFCNVLSSVVFTGNPGKYAVGLFTGSGSTIDAHVTMIGATDAYDAHVTGLQLLGAPGDRQSGGVLVTVPPEARIAYYYVDSYAIDGAAPVTCPSYVFIVDDRTVSAPDSARSIDAAHLQAIPALKCGRVYTRPELRGDLQSAVSSGYGDHSLVVVARSYIDSNGYSIREEIVQSSGVAGFDAYMLGAMHEHQFAPAKFLCTPVVGTIEVQLKYGP
jgi:hypothetical protein